jgi:hypothetical protein
VEASVGSAVSQGLARESGLTVAGAGLEYWRSKNEKVRKNSSQLPASD